MESLIIKSYSLINMNLLTKFDITNNAKNDLLSGFTVALALVPEAIAFAFVAGVDPLVGLYAAFFVGFITSVLGGRSGMISGATGAMAVVMVALVTLHGVQYLFAAIVVTGIIQMLAGILRFGKYINLVPTSVMLGFVNGLAIVIFLSQIGQFKDTNISHITESESHGGALDILFTGGWLGTNEMILMVLLTFLTMVFIWAFPKLPKVGKIIPAPLASIIIISFAVIGLNLDTKTVGDLASVSGGLPDFNIPNVPLNLETLLIVLPFSLTLAGVGLIESLLTLTLINELTETEGNNDRECFAQGLSNVVCGFFNAMGGCAMIGQSMINITSGGRGRLSGIAASIALLSFILFLSKWIEMIPIAALTGIMMMVVIGTFAWTTFKVVTRIPKSDAFVIFLVTIVTVAQDLAIAVIIGVIVSALVFAWKSSQIIRVSIFTSDENNSKTYELHGSLFFGSINRFKKIVHPSNDIEETVILDFKYAWLWDQSGVEAIGSLTEKYQQYGKSLIINNLGPNSNSILQKASTFVNYNLFKN